MTVPSHALRGDRQEARPHFHLLLIAFCRASCSSAGAACTASATPLHPESPWLDSPLRDKHTGLQVSAGQMLQGHLPSCSPLSFLQRRLLAAEVESKPTTPPPPALVKGVGVLVLLDLNPCFPGLYTGGEGYTGLSTHWLGTCKSAIYQRKQVCYTESYCALTSTPATLAIPGY